MGGRQEGGRQKELRGECEKQRKAEGEEEREESGINPLHNLQSAAVLEPMSISLCLIFSV